MFNIRSHVLDCRFRCILYLKNKLILNKRHIIPYTTQNGQLFNTRHRYNLVNYRFFNTLPEDINLEEEDVELELRSYCNQLKQFVVFDRFNENKNLNSFISRMQVNNHDEYLKKSRVTNFNNLKNLETYLNVLYTFSCCGFYINPDELKRLLSDSYNEYKNLLRSFRDKSRSIDPSDGHSDSINNNNRDLGNMSTTGIKYDSQIDKNKGDDGVNSSRMERLGRILSLAILSCCEMGIFKDNLRFVSEIIETFLFGEHSNMFLEKSTGKLIDSVLFLYSTTEFFEKDYDSEMESRYDSILQNVSKKETSLDLSDLYYLKLGHVFISSRIVGINKMLSKESINFLSNIVFQDYIKEKDLHGLEDTIPSKTKQIDSNIEGGLFNIGLYTFTHLSLPNRNVYLPNSPHHYFNSSLKFGKREYINWMDSFLKVSGWNLIYL